tara:strand:- start:3053 stop:4285 length:1233 start_codon:yes stop_codon:yes gene_type:complete
MSKNFQKHLLNRFKKTAKKKKKKKLKKTSKTENWKKKSFHVKRKKREVFAKYAPPAPVTNAVAVQKVTVVPEVVEAQSYSSNSLQLNDLIHPHSIITSSLEGFFLDQRSEHTRTAYQKDLKRFVRFLAMRKAQRGNEPLERTVFIAYKESLLNEGLQETTVDRHLATLRGVFEWMVEDGILEKNPVSRVRFLKPKRLSTTQAFTDEEVVKVLKKPNLHTRIGAQHYAMLMILFYCGVRRSELVSIRTSHVSMERGQPILRLFGKGNKERIVVMVDAVWNAIRYHLKISGKKMEKDQFLFTPVRNNRTKDLKKPMDPSMVYTIVTRYAKEAGITKKVSPHSCRATAISNARDHQVSDRAIQEFAGWASTEMITRYDKRKTAIEESAAHSIRYHESSQKKERELPAVPIKND